MFSKTNELRSAKQVPKRLIQHMTIFNRSICSFRTSEIGSRNKTGSAKGSGSPIGLHAASEGSAKTLVARSSRHPQRGFWGLRCLSSFGPRERGFWIEDLLSGLRCDRRDSRFVFRFSCRWSDFSNSTFINQYDFFAVQLQWSIRD